MDEILLNFNAEFATWGISLSPDQIAQRGRGKIVKAGWTIWYLFGSDKEGLYLDYYATHRMTNDRHSRFRANGECEELPTLLDARPCSEDSKEDARLEAEFLAENQRVSDLLEKKGFGITGTEPDGDTDQ